MTARPSEVQTFHTRILRCALAVPDARAYWGIADLGPTEGRAERAFREFWFGARSHARVETLLINLRARFDAFPEAHGVLRSWPDMDPATRSTLCHWHLQLSDPLYRVFTGRFLQQRRAEERPEVSLSRVVAWMDEQAPGKWAVRTRMKFASKLLSAAAEAGVVGSRKDPRPIRVPRVTDDALVYLLHLLRGIAFDGTLLENPYLGSVALTGDVLEARLRALSHVRHARQGNLVDLTFEHDDLASWFNATHPAVTP